eukprot:TRINITY_DN3607_c0_g1_i1.p1 TRINITY_DN3607_c0_g1~~TRINITY_DN3607_c0_g1_i1.p1  ORF type:complete len:174 (-),score=48.43 TRINITY_DN3607_c0_g1_i1:61-582(-)
MTTLSEKITIAKKKKEEGNESFKQKNYVDALKGYHFGYLYIKGLDAKNLPIPSTVELTAEQRREITELSLSLFLNMAACHLQLHKYDKVIEDCNKALGLSPENEKALFRQGQAYLALNDLEKAEINFEKVLKTSPNDHVVHNEFKRLRTKQKEADQQQKKVFAAMFGPTSSQE